jgi:heterodisulfide reductase subunit A2
MQKRPDVVVVGGGIAGITAALSLGQRGLQVLLIERESALGGNARTVCCKAVDGKCQLCGSCLLSDRLVEVKEARNIEVLTQTTVTRVERVHGGFSFALAPAAMGPSLAEDRMTGAIVLATGFDHVDAHTKGPYLYGLLPAITTGQEMERRLKEQGRAAYDTLNLRKVAFIQCVGSRDEHAGRGYCSQVCCRYALRLARLLKSRKPTADIAVFKMDIQTSGRDFAATWAAVGKEGIRLVAGLPAVIRRSPEDPQRATFLYDDTLAGKTVQEDFDLVVLAVGMQPRHDAGEVANLLGLNLDRYGFFAAGVDETSTLIPGVFLAGSCQAPRSIAESVAHAQRAAEACTLYSQGREP